MSYARFGCGGSDVYIFLSVEGHLECCACAIKPDGGQFHAHTTAAMIAHLDQHRAAGHTVEDDTYANLQCGGLHPTIVGSQPNGPAVAEPTTKRCPFCDQEHAVVGHWMGAPFAPCPNMPEHWMLVQIAPPDEWAVVELGGDDG